MKGLSVFTTATVLLAAACGGSEPAQEERPASEPAASEAAEPASTGELTQPGWYRIDEAAQTVTLDVSAGANPWNFSGFNGGDGEIVVPEGYEVTINFTNDDPNMAHSIGVDARRSGFPGSFGDPVPAFDGGMSSNPTSMTDGTMPGESETLTFTASEAGEYSLVCYIPGHASIGMYVHFNVSSDGSAGVRE